MAQLKAHEVDAWLEKPRPDVTVVLAYGPDRGLVSERARKFALASGVPLDDPFSLVRLEAADLEKVPGLLTDEANTLPLFSGRRLLWIRNASAQKSLAEEIKRLCAAPPPDTVILVEAGELRKGTGLRSVVEDARTGMALPCYTDDSRSIDALIDEELGRAGLRIDGDARALLRGNLGGDRLASRSEVVKLALYGLGKEALTIDDVRALTGDASASSLDEPIDAALSGDLAAFDQAFSRRAGESGFAFALLSGLHRQLQSLQLMRAAMEGSGASAAAAVAAARPPVFFARRRLVEQILARCDSRTLATLLEALQSAVLETRRRPELARSVTYNLVVAVARAGRNLRP